MQVVFYNKLTWFVSGLPEKDMSNMVCNVDMFISELINKCFLGQ